MFDNIKNKLQQFVSDKQGQGAVAGLLALIAIGTVGAIIVGVILASTMSTSIYNANATFVNIRDSMVPLFALATVGGAVIGAVLIGLLGFLRK